MEHVSMDKEALHAYQMREMALIDWASGIDHARKEGEKKGEKKRELEIARNLKNINVSIEQISQATGLSSDEIAKL